MAKTRIHTYLKNSNIAILHRVSKELTKKNKVYGKPRVTVSELLDEAIEKTYCDPLEHYNYKLEKVSEEINRLENEREQCKEKIRKFRKGRSSS